MAMNKKFPSFAGNVWAGSFCRALRRELRGVVGEPGSIVREARQRAVEMYRGLEGSMSDPREESMIASCCLVLATYRVLVAQLPEAEVIRHIQNAVALVFQKPMRMLMRVWLWFARRPISGLSKNRWRRFSEWMYGPGMGFSQEEDLEKVDLIVHRCAFHRFFVEHDAPQLTRVFCLWDRNWMDVINSSRRTVRTERPSTLASGGDCCRFRVVVTPRATDDAANDIALDVQGGA